MGKFRQFLTELSARDTSIFSFQDNNSSKSQRIFTQLDMCIDIVEILFGIAIGYISVFDRVVSSLHDSGGVLSFHNFISGGLHISESLLLQRSPFEKVGRNLKLNYKLNLPVFTLP